MQDERLKTTNYFVSLYEELEKVEDRAFFESFEARAFDNIAFDILENLLSKNYIKSAIFAIDDLRKIPNKKKKRADIRFVLKDSLDYIERFIFNKLLGGSFRIGVSSKTLINTLAKHYDLDPSAVTHSIMGHWNPDEVDFDEDALCPKCGKELFPELPVEGRDGEPGPEDAK